MSLNRPIVLAVLAVLAVLLGAAPHASWNALVKSAAD